MAPADSARQADLFGDSQDEPPRRQQPPPETPSASAEGEVSFEEAFTELEKAVQDLEQGKLSLEEALAVFERGMSYARICIQRLNAAELKVTQLTARLEEGPDLPPEEQT